MVEPAKKPAVEEKIEEKLAIQAKPHRSKWARQFVMATGVLAILGLELPLAPHPRLRYKIGATGTHATQNT
jgi:hypothetical protein